MQIRWYYSVIMTEEQLIKVQALLRNGLSKQVQLPERGEHS